MNFLWNFTLWWNAVSLVARVNVTPSKTLSSHQETSKDNSSRASNKACQNSLSTVQFHCLDPQQYLTRGRGMPARPFQSFILTSFSASTNIPKSCLFALKIISLGPVSWSVWHNLSSNEVSVGFSFWEVRRVFWLIPMFFICAQCWLLYLKSTNRCCDVSYFRHFLGKVGIIKVFLRTLGTHPAIVF